MHLLHSITELSKLSGPLILIGGTFDGVHRGHQALLQRAQEEAQRHHGQVVVLTFDQHPFAFLRPHQAPRLLTTTSQKIKYLYELGVEALLLLAFNQDLAATPAEQFIEQLATAGPALKTICLGESWSFGQGGKGNVALLRKKGAEFHFDVMTMAPIQLAGVPVSSTRIRQAIALGNLEEATACLGRHYQLSSIVVHGAGRGKKLGFPTANLNVGFAQLPPYGVYAVVVQFEGSFYQGVANIGLRPTLESSSSSPVVEVHLFDFVGDLYGKEMSVELVKFLRSEKKFATLDELQNQILSDVEEARKILVIGEALL